MIKMSISQKIEFSKRMSTVADILKIPPMGKNRQAALGKMFSVSQEAARKWLAGESYPKTETCIEIALKSEVSMDWLLTGRSGIGIKKIDWDQFEKSENNYFFSTNPNKKVTLKTEQPIEKYLKDNIENEQESTLINSFRKLSPKKKLMIMDLINEFL
jgi:hypothetical protein